VEQRQGAAVLAARFLVLILYIIGDLAEAQRALRLAAFVLHGAEQRQSGIVLVARVHTIDGCARKADHG